MSFDITHLLEKWDYQPGEVLVRRFKGKDGSEKIQLRLDLGLLQMNLEGRPDGKHPLGHESLLEYYESKLEKHITEHKGEDEGFTLKAEDCAKLQQEAIQYHHRYICLYQLRDYQGVLRDTDRNLEVFDLVEEYADSDDLAWSLQQFRPQLLLMRTRALGTMAMDEDDYDTAIEHIQTGLDDMRAFYQEQERLDLLETSGEIRSLEDWLSDVRNKRPLSEREKLELKLSEAVEREDYETAAEVRDKLRNLKTSD